MTITPVIDLRELTRNPVGDDAHAYIAELKLVETPEELEAFVERWQQVWTVPFRTKTEPVGLGDFDAAEALSCINYSRATVCPHAGKPGLPCHGMRIVMPELLMTMHTLSKVMHIPANLALHRLLSVI